MLFSYVSRDLLNTLAARDLEAFTELIGRFALALALATPVSVLFKFQRGRVSLLWREWMFGVLAGLYANERTFYRLEVARIRVRVRVRVRARLGVRVRVRVRLS